MRGKRSRQLRSKIEAGFGAPLAFLLAASAQAAPDAGLSTVAVSFEPGALRDLVPNASVEIGIGAQDPAKPQGGLSVDRGTQTVQWFNWSNWTNCFSGVWRNC